MSAQRNGRRASWSGRIAALVLGVAAIGLPSLPARAAEPTWTFTDDVFVPAEWEQSFHAYTPPE